MNALKINELRHRLIDMFYEVDAALKAGGFVRIETTTKRRKTCMCTENCFCMGATITTHTIVLGDPADEH